ncbi:hypothetical protein BJF88_11610 [Cellulosimicrobium sp. CUA-896]|nr:hypothetical protein BJF88_11610 [Cellulosimicrobium sp. CUA-896]
MDPGGPGGAQGVEERLDEAAPVAAALRGGEQVDVQVRGVGGDDVGRRRRRVVDESHEGVVARPIGERAERVALAQRRPPALLARRLERRGVARAEHVADGRSRVVDDEREVRLEREVRPEVHLPEEARVGVQGGRVAAGRAGAQADVVEPVDLGGVGGPGRADRQAGHRDRRRPQGRMGTGRRVTARRGRAR